MRNKIWTEEEKKRAEELLLEGKTYAEVAIILNDEFNTNRTRSAVITMKRDGGFPKLEKKNLPTIPAQYRSGNLIDINNKSVVENKILNYLQHEPLTVGELSRRIDRSKETVIKIIDKLREKGYDVELKEDSKQVVLERDIKKEFEPLELKPLYRNRVRIGVISDTQIGSKYQQMGLLHTCYKIGEEEKIDCMFHCGDLFDAIGVYRGQHQELFLHGVDDQVEYAINNYPYTKKFKTYIISGNHELAVKKAVGHNMVRYFCEKRNDLRYRGDGWAKFRFKGLTFELLHASGGTAYARSYKPQKIIENIVANLIEAIRTSTLKSRDFPHALFMGHWHITEYLEGYMGVDGFSVASLQSQTPYLKSKGLSPRIGMLLVEFQFDRDGNINRILPDFRKMNAQAKENDY